MHHLHQVRSTLEQGFFYQKELATSSFRLHHYYIIYRLPFPNGDIYLKEDMLL